MERLIGVGVGAGAEAGAEVVSSEGLLCGEEEEPMSVDGEEMLLRLGWLQARRVGALLLVGEMLDLRK